MSATLVKPAQLGSSRALAQRSLVDPDQTYPLWPPILSGDPATETADMQYPLEIAYDWSGASADDFRRPPLPGLGRWAATLPPLAAAVDLAAGGTPLVRARHLEEFVDAEAEVWVKDESRNPTWSHKDRLNTVAVSAAALSGAPGVVVASSGNHGASAAAHAAAAGLRCVVVTSRGAPQQMADLMDAYGAVVLETETDKRWPLLNEVVSRYGFHAVSSTTPVPTGHPYGPEGYKTVAYELFNQMDGAPDAVFVPTGYGELLFGVWKGFAELHHLGMCEVPRLYSCEPGRMAPLAEAFEQGLSSARVTGVPTPAWSISCTVSGYRGVRALTGSAGAALRISDQEMTAASGVMSRCGMWAEFSAAAGVAGLRQRGRAGHHRGHRVVCINTSAGMKTGPLAGETNRHEFTGDWSQLDALLVDGRRDPRDESE